MKSNLIDPTDKTVTVRTLMARKGTRTIPDFGRSPEIKVPQNTLGETDRLTSKPRAVKKISCAICELTVGI